MIYILILILLLTALFYYFCIRPHNYWTKRGVKQGQTVWMFGNIYHLILRLQSIAEWNIMLYNMFPGTRYCGAYAFVTPQLIIRDPELIKQITVKDFEYFMNRQQFVSPKTEPLWSKNLVLLQGQEWKDMRNLMSPAYTSSKMKFLFNLIVECSESFVNYFSNNEEKIIRVKIVDVFSRFTNDVIATTAYGIKIDSLKHPNNEFVLKGRKATTIGFSTLIIFFAYQTIPKLCEILGIRFLQRTIAQFFTNAINETITVREEKEIVRNDMLHILIEAKKHLKEQDSEKHITNQDIAAQAFIFFLGGLDTVSSLLSMLSYELAINSDVQNKLRKEIEETKKQCQGKLTYDALMEMKYMEMVISETLRKWPSMTNLQRKCTKPYVIEPTSPDETAVNIEQDTVVVIPVVGIHRDPKYWPNPEKFDPERFSEENKTKIRQYTYLPFGVGPRMCIGNRFTLTEVKTLVFHLLSAFEIVPVAETETPVRLDKAAIGLKPVEDTIVGFKRLF